MKPGKRPEATEGWESLVEEASAGSLAPNPELEQAMREAADAVEAHRLAAAGGATPEVPKGAAVDERMAELERELEVMRDRHLRLAADFDNARRRWLREKEEAHQFGHQNLVKDLLPTVDNLERAIEHARQSGSGDLQSLLQGVELVARELVAALTRYGLGVVSAEGEPFDPARHEALAQLEDASAPEGTVLKVLQRGYRLRDRLLRPARVLVAKRPAGPTAREGGAPVQGPESRGGEG